MTEQVPQLPEPEPPPPRRTRPTMADWHAARDLEWYGANPDWLLREWNGRWTVFESDDPYNQTIHCRVDTLREAIRVARRLAGASDG